MAKYTKIIFLSLIAVTSLILYCPEKVKAIAVRPVSPSGEQVKGDQWLFVIGIDTYLEWPRLKTAVNDAKAVRDVLLERYYFDQDHLVELYDEQATRRNILGQLRYLANKTSPEDSLVVFYAGHGHLDPITREGFWIPVESGTKDVAAWISNHDIKNYLRVDAIKAKHILLISDSCFAGDFFRGQRGKLPEVTDARIKSVYGLNSRLAIASGGLEPVSDEGFGKNSVFSYFLVKTLEDNQKPFLIPSDLYPKIKAGVIENAQQFPQWSSLVGTGGQQGGEIVLFLKQNYKLKQLSSEAQTKQVQLERLQKMEANAIAAKKREDAEIATYEQQVSELDAKIEAMQKRLGSPAVRQDDSLDAMLAIVKQKESQAAKMERLRKQREIEEAKRNAEIRALKLERDKQISTMLKPEVEKYKQIVQSKYGASMKEAAWQGLVAKCPPGWADNVYIGDLSAILLSPTERKILAEKKRLEEQAMLIKKRKEIEERKRLEEELGREIKRDGNFIAYTTGVVYDKNTGLKWVAGPNRGTEWNKAKRWVEGLNVAGGGWRMPTRQELKTLYKKGAGLQNTTPLLQTTGWWVWSGETDGWSSAWYFNFKSGSEDSMLRDKASYFRGFAVCSRR